MSERILVPDESISTWIDLLRWRATQHPTQRLYTFLADGETEKEQLTFAELDTRARAIGSILQRQATEGDRALLIYPSGLEFIAAFFGCLYSGIVAVPVYPPSATRSERALAKFRAIAYDVQPSCILTTSALSSRVEGLLAQSPELRTTQVIVVDEISLEAAANWQAPAIANDSLAFFQYTSGSTGMPKGVMVTHASLLHNSSLIERYCQHPSDACCVTWLPLYHDLGLIGGLLQPVYSGFSSVVMSPAAFLQKPIRWLQAISRYKATLSGGPNFAYDLCVNKVTSEQKAALDLSHWEIAANGAEPVRAETLERFVGAFSSCGFRREAFCPCYGMAEATLVVSAKQRLAPLNIKAFDTRALEHHQAVEYTDSGPLSGKVSRALVACGRSLPDQKIVIVNPDTQVPCLDGQIGEIWVAGPSVARGYWKRSEETEYTFWAHLSDSGEGPFLRTGDLGFLHHEELFITGRLKDLIIIHGTNHYPQDIESTVERCHPALRPACGAAFSVEVAGEERLVIVQEVERQYLRASMEEVVEHIRRAVAEQHELQVYAVVLVKPGSMFKTSSGKVQRRASKQSFLDEELDAIFVWRLNLSEKQADAIVMDEDPTEKRPAVKKVEAAEPVSPPSRKTQEEIQNWLLPRIAHLLTIDPSAIDVHTPFASYGMDSVRAVSLSGELEEWLGRQFSPTLMYDYPDIATLSRYLADEPEHKAEERIPEEKPVLEANDAIALIGLGCRFPGANNPEEFWKLLHEKRDGISEVPAKRWDIQAYYDPNETTPGKMNTRWGGFLDQIDQFDPYFFGISPREAAHMDPQQRLLLEVAWEALEHAGLAPEKLAGSQTGVFIGISSDDYSRLQFDYPADIDAYAGTGNAHSIAANRLSYQLDLHGPSVAIDTACSSSLVAVHMACQSLRNGECDVALAGGVNVILSPELTITFSQAHMMSPDGRCKTFDEAANGYVRAEGCGVVVLKSYAQALRDGDTILALIRGSAINQDGRSNGLTAPNGLAQEAVIRQALRHANVAPDQVSFVETHGSSTSLGDPIEVGALKSVLMQDRTNKMPCVLGAVKSNIGHLEAAAGIAGLIKTVLCLQKREIAPNLHFEKLNPHISLEGTTFVIPTERFPWPRSERRLAGVSAFGFGGTNAHIILEEAPKCVLLPNELERLLHILALSARTEHTLRTLAGRYIAFLEGQPEASIADICFTANSGRAHFAHRLAVVANSQTHLRERLVEFIDGQSSRNVVIGHVRGSKRPKVAFLFTGQGSQYIGMGRHLYDTQPTFRKSLDRCAQILQAYLKEPLLSVMYPESAASPLLNETAYTQPALFALEYALAEMWRSWGIEPDAVLGHSVGEYVAACVAGVFSLEDGLKLVAARGRLMQEVSPAGDMVVVFAEPEYVEKMLEPFKQQVSIAAINGPKNIVISGDREAIHTLVSMLEAEAITTRQMAVSHAFHSPLMEPMLPSFEEIARQICYGKARIPLVSNVTGHIVAPDELLDAAYWKRQIRETVHFSQSMQTLEAQGYEIFLEVGPDAHLSNMAHRFLSTDRTLLPSLRKGRDDWHIVLSSVASCYTHGVDPAWQQYDGDYTRQKIVLPTYPFERQYCWFEARGEERPALEAHTWSLDSVQRHPLLDTHVELIQPAGVHVWEAELGKARLPYLEDHRIQGTMAVPVSVYVEMAQAATVEAFGPGIHELTEIELKKLLFLPEEGSQKVQIVLSANADEHMSFLVYSHSTGVPEQPRSLWTLHATGKILPNESRRG